MGMWCLSLFLMTSGWKMYTELNTASTARPGTLSLRVVRRMSMATTTFGSLLLQGRIDKIWTFAGVVLFLEEW